MAEGAAQGAPAREATRAGAAGARLGREGLLGLALMGGLLAWPVIAVLAGEPYEATLAARVAILALAGVGLNLALGQGGMVSLGHAAFFGIGGYVAGISADAAFSGAPAVSWPVTLAGTTSMPVIWLVAIGLSGLVAAAIGAISLRTTGVYFIMITLAFAQMIYYFAISWPAYGGEDGLPIYLRNTLPGVDTGDPLSFFLIAYALLSGALFLSWRIQNSRFGSALACARMNPDRLAALGIEPFPVKLLAFVLSAMITGLAGALFADLNGFVSPAMLGWHTSGEIIIFVLLGGVGRLMGPVAGALLFILLETVLGGLTEHWQLGLGLALLGTVLFAPGGLIGLLAGPRRG